MPNWCFNYATITCPTKELYDKLINAIIENKWFETFAPLNSDPEIHENEWDYAKAVEIWKTKWAVFDVEILSQNDDELELVLSFETAWTPPTGVYSIMKNNYGIETIGMFDEPGCSFFGKCIYSREEEIEEFFDFPSNEEELQELQKQIGSELDEYMSPTWLQLREDWEEEDEDEDEDEEYEEYGDSLPELIEINSDEDDDCDYDDDDVHDDEDELDKPEINEIKNLEW